MLNNRPLITVFCVSLILFTQANYTHACFFHGGFGNSPWSNYEPRSGGLRYNGTNSVSKIKLSLPSMIRAKVKKEEALTVSYSYMSEGENPTIQLFVDISPGITIADNKVNLIGKSGQHTFMLQPQTSGIYRLMVTARDLNNNDIPSLRETVYVNIYE